MSELPEWKDYPRRDECVIASGLKSSVTFYGIPYVLIPFDNANFGVCPSINIWGSFGNNPSIDDFNKIVESMGLLKYVDNYDLPGLKKHFINDEKFEFEISKDNYVIQKYVISVYEKGKYLLKNIEYNGNNPNNIKLLKLLKNKYEENTQKNNSKMEDLWNIMITYFSPDPIMNNFIHMNYSKFQKVNWKAYWTDSKCLLIDEKLYDNILKII